MSILKDAVAYNDYAKSSSSDTNENIKSDNLPTVNIDDIRLAIAARTSHQSKSILNKELQLELSTEKNAKPLPPITPRWGLNLPPEKYCLTARDWFDIDDSDSENNDSTSSIKKNNKNI